MDRFVEFINWLRNFKNDIGGEMKCFKILTMILMFIVSILMTSPAVSSVVAYMPKRPIPKKPLPLYPIPIDYSGAWLPNSDDIFAIDLTPTNIVKTPHPFLAWDLQQSGAFYLYDWGEPSNNLLLFERGAYAAATVNFDQNGDGWIASVIRDGSTYTLNLGEDQLFGFFFGSSDAPLLDYQLRPNGEDSYLLLASLPIPLPPLRPYPPLPPYPPTPLYSSDLHVEPSLYISSRMIVSVSDAAPVPLPPAIWLFGSGLAGLVGINRRRNRNRV